MPSAAPAWCPRCQTPHSDGCAARLREQRKALDLRRGTAAARGYGSQWQRIRARYLAQNPLCVRCLANHRTEVAVVVDHVVPKSQGGTDDASNYQALCVPCHNRKTAREDRARG